MNRTIPKAMAACMAAATITASALTTQAVQASDFLDVKPTAWYYQAVDYAAREGLFAGTSATTFSPEVGMTRAMFVTVLGRIAGAQGQTSMTSRFTDVNPTSWYSPYVEWAAEQQIVSGVGSSKFAPNEKITWEQLAVMLMRYVRSIHGDTSFSASALSRFSDQEKVSGYAREAMAWAVSKEIISGADGKLMPQGTATRAQAAQMLMSTQKLFQWPKENGGEQDALQEIWQHLEKILPISCRWSEGALQAGWYGPYILEKDGTPSQIAEEMTFVLTQVDEFTYDVYYITEPTAGEFYLYYGWLQYEQPAHWPASLLHAFRDPSNHQEPTQLLVPDLLPMESNKRLTNDSWKFIKFIMRAETLESFRMGEKVLSKSFFNEVMRRSQKADAFWQTRYPRSFSASTAKS